MGVVEELSDSEDDNFETIGKCNLCKAIAEKQCVECQNVFYCSRNCQRNDWKKHKYNCTKYLYKICESKEKGRYLIANKDIKKNDVILTEKPLITGPQRMSRPMCVACYNLVDGSYRSKKSGWPMCNRECEEKARKNPEVVVPSQTGAEFEIDDYNQPCYLYDAIAPIRAILLQKTNPKLFSKLLKLESHVNDREKSSEWVKRCAETIFVMKKTLGLMVFEALQKDLDLSDDMIKRIIGIFDTNSLEIRLSTSELSAIYETVCLVEHSCLPNLHITFDEHFKIKLTAACDIPKGSNLSIMYTHCLWGTYARRLHLAETKLFWCKCPRCQDPTEYGTNISTIIKDGQELTQKNPLDPTSPWTSTKRNDLITQKEIVIPVQSVVEEMEEIHQKLMEAQSSTDVSQMELFIKSHSDKLHPNHYHMLTAKHALLQMIGRTEGFLIQDIDESLLDRKENLCHEVLKVFNKLDPNMTRLQVYKATTLYELHLVILQRQKRQWQESIITTEEFREKLNDPKAILVETINFLENETNPNLPEGQIKFQAEETLTQLDDFMKTLGC